MLFISLITNTEQVSAAQWTKDFETNKIKGKISNDGKKCWIQGFDESMIKKNVLKIPSKVKGAKVVRIGRPRDMDGEIYNILDSSWDWCNAELSAKSRSLKKVVIPNSVEYIDDYCFMMLSGIKTIKLPKRLKRIGESAFTGCYSIEKMKLPNSVTSIGNNAFNGCRRLKTISIGKNVKYISNSAFIDCISLEKVTIHKKNKRYRAKTGYIYEKGKNSLFLIYTQKKEFTIPGGIKTISEHCFQSGKAESVKISAGVKEIRNDAFSVNRKLKIVVTKANKTFANLDNHVIKKADGTLVCMDGYDKKDMILPEGIKIVQEDMSIIGDGHSFKKLVFPSTLKTVKLTPNYYTKFYSYFELKEMHFKGKKPPVFTQSFGCDNTIYVPKGTKKAYVKAFKDGSNKVKEV